MKVWWENSPISKGKRQRPRARCLTFGLASATITVYFGREYSHDRVRVFQLQEEFAGEG